MDIVYASDNRFAQILGVSLLSLFDNNSDADLSVYILDDGITNENKEKLLSIAQKYNRGLKFVSIPDLDQLAAMLWFWEIYPKLSV